VSARLNAEESTAFTSTKHFQQVSTECLSIPIGDGIFYSILCIVHTLGYSFFTNLVILVPLNGGGPWL